MKDRYLFKAKSLDNGEWVVGYYAVIGQRNVIIEKCVENYYCPDTCESRHGNKIHEVNSKTICQCTGLKDKNGKLIWENDIAKGHRISFGSHRHIGKVKYINGHYEIIGVKQYTGFSGALSLSYEVLGNIFDNPELLESEE